jgi:hypothetical protein
MKKILALALFVLVSQAYALNEYYSISRSIRALGMGGAFYGLSDDEYALFYNPAGLANYRGSGKLLFSLGAQVSNDSFSQISKVANVAKDKKGSISDLVTTLGDFAGKPMYADVNLMPISYVRKNFAIGLMLNDTKIQAGLLGRDFDTYMDITALSDSGLLIGYGRSFTDNLSIGLNLKGILRAGGHKTYTILEIAQQGKVSTNLQDLGGVGFGIDADLGAIYNIQNLPFGILNQASLTFNNLVGSRLNMVKVGDAGPPPALERTMSLGFHSVFPGYGWIDNFHVLVDFAEFGIGGNSASADLGARSGSFWKHVNWGVEAPMNGWFVLRGGFHQGNLSAGLGIRTLAFELDFATYAEELFTGINRVTSRRVGLRLAIGVGSTPPPPLYPRPANELSDPKFDDSRSTKKAPIPEAVEKKEPVKPVTPAPTDSKALSDEQIKKDLEKGDLENGKKVVPPAKPEVTAPVTKEPPPPMPKPAAPKVKTPKPEVDRFDVDSMKEENTSIDDH